MDEPTSHESQGFTFQNSEINARVHPGHESQSNRIKEARFLAG